MTVPTDPPGPRSLAIAELADPAKGAMDLDALLVALVLVPASYARNRFEPLYRNVEVRQVRGRAAMVRSIVSDLTCGVASQRAALLDVERLTDGTILLSYEVPPLGLRRRSKLVALELALVQHLLARIEAVRRPGQRPWKLAAGLERLSGAGGAEGGVLRQALLGLF